MEQKRSTQANETLEEILDGLSKVISTQIILCFQERKAAVAESLVSLSVGL